MSVVVRISVASGFDSGTFIMVVAIIILLISLSPWFALVRSIEQEFLVLPRTVIDHNITMNKQKA